MEITTLIFVLLVSPAQDVRLSKDVDTHGYWKLFDFVYV